jgi:hypothetical protein
MPSWQGTGPSSGVGSWFWFGADSKQSLLGQLKLEASLRFSWGNQVSIFDLDFHRPYQYFFITLNASSWLACPRAFPSRTLLEPFCHSSGVSVLFVPFFSPFPVPNLP